MSQINYLDEWQVLSDDETDRSHVRAAAFAARRVLKYLRDVANSPFASPENRNANKHIESLCYLTGFSEPDIKDLLRAMNAASMIGDGGITHKGRVIVRLLTLLGDLP